MKLAGMMGEKEQIRRMCFDLWGLDNPDPVEAYHALRIMYIKSEMPVPTFDDFMVLWIADDE